MTVSGFFSFLLFLNALPCCASVCFGKRPEKLFAAGLLLNGLVFYLACAAGCCRAGFHLLYAANLALYVPVFLKLRKAPDAFANFLTPAVQVFELASAAAFLLALREHIVWWDEFSHWASAPKFLFKYGVLNCAQSDLLRHASYPPGLPVLDVLVNKCFVGVGFRDLIPRFAVRELTLALALLPLGYGDRKSYRHSVMCILTFCTVGIALSLRGFWTCEADCILGCLFAAAVFVAMRHDGSVRDDLYLALLLAWLFLVKKAGMGFAVMVLCLYFVRWIADRRDEKLPKRPVWSALLVALAPFLAQGSWSLLLKLHHTPVIFSVGGISFAGIARLVFHGEPAYAGPVALRFLKAYLKELPYFALALAALALYRRHFADRPRRTCDLWWFLPLALAGFTASLFLTYVFIFSELQARLLVSFDRYMRGFLLMPLLALQMLVSSGKLPNRRIPKFLPYAAVVAMLAWGANSYVSAAVRGGGVALRWRSDLAELESKYGTILRSPGERFTVVTGEGFGIYHFIFRYEFDREFAEELRPVSRITSDVDDSQKVLSVEELRERFRRVRHVLFLRPKENVARDYAALWETPPGKLDGITLFEVSPSGKLRPMR